jgi:catechol 2,3-dioxygenase-like lactoylglutathione lyase family enzyme
MRALLAIGAHSSCRGISPCRLTSRSTRTPRRRQLRVVRAAPVSFVSHVHLAFQARDRATVHKLHVAALAAGGHDNGGPGERDYHPGYYAAFVLDPDGTNIEAVYHGPYARSASSVVVTPAD